MNDPSPTGHAAWFADVRRIIDITEVTPGLPLPRIAPDRAVYFFIAITHPADAQAAIRDAETILGYALDASFVTRRTRAGSTEHHILTAILRSGLQVDLVALAEQIDAAPLGDRDHAEAAAA
jgi:hypothetical protein